jgi:ABC-type sugar transport system permease subunit
VIVWKELGFGIILCLARLMSVNEEMFESARIDGARWWQTFRYVTLPQLMPAIVFFAVVETITMLSWVFAYIYVMTSGGPGNSTVVSEWYIFQQVFSNGVIGIGSAAAVTLLAFVSLLIVVRLWLLRRFDDLAYAG